LHLTVRASAERTGAHPDVTMTSRSKASFAMGITPAGRYGSRHRAAVPRTLCHLLPVQAQMD